MQISGAKLREKIGFRPHPAQEEILKAETRDIAICAGRRFGKSVLSAYLILKNLLVDERKAWIVSPTYELSQKVFDYVVGWIGKSFPSLQAGIVNRPFAKIITPWRSWVECRSAENPTGLLGEEVDLLIVDEASRISKRIWEQYLLPTTASRKGRTIFISTPFGKNWFYDQWLRVKGEGGAFRFTSLDNPFFPKDEWERARKLLPERVFKQEYLAEFLEDAASVFRGVREIINDEALRDAVPGHFYVMGVDLAKHEDFTVITVVDRSTHQVVHFDRFKEISYPLQKKRIGLAAKWYNNAKLYLDATGVGDPIAEDLRLEGLLVEDFKYSRASKSELIEKLSIFIEQKKIFIPPVEALIDELESFGYHLTEHGNVRYEAPEGLHDDCVNSLALAVWGLQNIHLPETPKDRMVDFIFDRSEPEVEYIHVPFI